MSVNQSMVQLSLGDQSSEQKSKNQLKSTKTKKGTSIKQKHNQTVKPVVQSVIVGTNHANGQRRQGSEHAGHPW